MKTAEHIAGREAVEVVAYVTTGFSGGPRTRRAFTVTKADANQQHENWVPHYQKVTTDELMTVAQHERILAAWQRTQGARAPDFAGIGRDAGHPRAVVLYLRAEPTDDDLRAIQEALRFAAAPAQPAAQGKVHCSECGLAVLDCDKRGCFGLTSAHGQGEVQRLREPTPAMVQAACAAFRMDISPMQAMYEALRAALAASTGQEV